MVLTKKAIESEIHINKTSELLHKLEINYKNVSSYILAFIHRSLVNERPDFAPEHNERLEFLWDAVLELIITNKLFIDYPEKSEGELTDIRSALVRGKNLAKVARTTWLPQHLLLGKWEELSWWRDNDYLLANLVESFLWAIYLDSGYDEAKKFVLQHIYPTIEDILRFNLTKDYKTLIQEYAQAHYDITPTYKIISEQWPDHNKEFEVGIYFGEKLIETWTGSSKKKAQESAANKWFIKIKK